MSSESLANRLVRLVAERQLQRYASEYQADHLTWRDFAIEAGEDVVAVLRELAKPSTRGPGYPYLDPTYSAMALYGMADEIEAR